MRYFVNEMLNFSPNMMILVEHQYATYLSVHLKFLYHKQLHLVDYIHHIIKIAKIKSNINNKGFFSLLQFDLKPPNIAIDLYKHLKNYVNMYDEDMRLKQKQL